jgi:hypothetical protein
MSIDLMAHIGGLLPARQGERTDKQLPTTTVKGLGIHANTLTLYRKVTKHRDRIDSISILSMAMSRAVFRGLFFYRRR